MKSVFSIILNLTLFFACFCNSSAAENTPDDKTDEWAQGMVSYCNPITFPDETGWPDYGFGDPFVFRFNGRYYLYPSTRDDETGIKCWSSRDLVHWNYEGLCTTEPVTKGAYAPEVVYWNGAFYMYTSPAGRGHYVLKSDAPTGPFVVVSENIGFSIDGSVFIDDDGAWYFYHAFERGILGRRMSAPNKIDPTSTLIGSSMNGWTEGPMVVKHDGIYYVTYTGNHVISRGYRIDAGAGSTPLRFFPSTNNPILISTQDTLYGIGHSSTVKGPNLDLYYMVYHSRVKSGKQGWPVREMNIDRLVFNRDSLSVAGPTRQEQSIPLADWALWFDSSDDLKHLRTICFSPISNTSNDVAKTERNIQINDGYLRLTNNQAALSDRVFSGDFTAEFHLSTPDSDASAGCLFCYVDSDNYGSVEVKGNSGRIKITFVTGGAVFSNEIQLPKSFGENLSFMNVQGIEIERSANTFTFYVNDRRVFDCSREQQSGAIGYYTCCTNAQFGYLAATAATEGGSAAALAQPIPGTVYFHHQKTQNGKIAVERKFSAEGRLMVHALTEGEKLTTELNVAESGEYDIIVRGVSDKAGSIEISIDGCSNGPLRFEGENKRDSVALFSTIIRNITLISGTKQLVARCEHGNFDLAEIELIRHNDVEPLKDFAASVDHFTYSDGSWKNEDGALVSDAPAYFGKRLYGADGWGDYRVEADLTFLDKSRNAGILVRTQNPSLGGANNSVELGTDFFQGYFVGFGPHSVQLSRHNYNWIPLQERRWDFADNKRVHVCVVAMGDKITVELDGKKALEFTESNPFFTGRVGVRTCGTPVKVENFRVIPL